MSMFELMNQDYWKLVDSYRNLKSSFFLKLFTTSFESSFYPPFNFSLKVSQLNAFGLQTNTVFYTLVCHQAFN